MSGIQWGNAKITVEKVPDSKMTSTGWESTKNTVKQDSYYATSRNVSPPINSPRSNEYLLNSAEREIANGKYHEAEWHLQKAEEYKLSATECNRLNNLKAMLILKQSKDSIQDKQEITTKIGVITVLNEKIRKGLIESGGKEYLIKEYKGDAYHKLKIGDKVRFRPVNPNIAESVIYLSIYYEKLKVLYSQYMDDVNERLKVFLNSFDNSISLEEALKDIENLKKCMCLERIGIIKTFDSKNGTGTIKYGGEEYQIILKKNCRYKNFPIGNVKIGDRIRCLSTIDNKCFYTEDITWLENYYDVLTKYYKYQLGDAYDDKKISNFIQENKLAEKYEVTKEIICQDLREIQKREETEVQQMIMQLKKADMN